MLRFTISPAFALLPRPVQHLAANKSMSLASPEVLRFV
jgi:hypothetical protein